MPPLLKTCTCKTSCHETCLRRCTCQNGHDLNCHNRKEALLEEVADLRARAKIWREVWKDKDLAERLETIANRCQAAAEGRPWVDPEEMHDG